MIIHMNNTSSAAVGLRLEELRDTVGSVALGRVLTLVIIAKALSAAAKALLAGDRCRKYAAFEECGEMLGIAILLQGVLLFIERTAPVLNLLVGDHDDEAERARGERR